MFSISPSTLAPSEREDRDGLIARTRRQVHEQEVQPAPLSRGEQLTDGAALGLAAPHDRRHVSGPEKGHGKRLDAGVGLHRVEPESPVQLGLFFDTQHLGNAGAMEVRVEDADPPAGVGQRGGQVHRGGGLAHAALAGQNGDLVFDVLQCVGNRPLLRQLLFLQFHEFTAV
jgi:hypothetical protein